MNRFFLCISCLFVLSTEAQQIVVVDKLENTPIPAAAVYNSLKTKIQTTDINGLVSIDEFAASEKINFQHISYQNILVSKSSIKTLFF